MFKGKMTDEQFDAIRRLAHKPEPELFALPFSVDAYLPYDILGANGRNVATVYPRSNVDGDGWDELTVEQAATTARLFAAAPELLEAAEIMLGDVERAPNRFRREEKIRIARAAVAKARGLVP